MTTATTMFRRVEGETDLRPYPPRSIRANAGSDRCDRGGRKVRAMRISFAGKGGSGKTTISATVARTLARRGHEVRAIDADSNPNLGIALGIPAAQALGLDTLPKDVARRDTDEDGNRVTILLKKPGDLFAEYGVDAPDGVRLLVGSRIGHAGAG